MYPEKSCSTLGILYLATVKRFTAAPCAGNAINVIVNPVFNALNFKSIQAAIIGNAFPIFAVFPFIHCSNPFQPEMV